ncbi:MAG: hypothetical protein P4L35_11540 [Ignavibacteriaceae bacterium]|nr:hypothetical protein [Ignavibacteriaceae bacterium]
MSKRFTDTNIWDQSWFLELSPEGKNIWQFLEKSCDCAGIWKIDIPEMRRKIGCKNIDLANFLEEVNKDYNKLTGEEVKRNRVMLIASDTKLWMTGFISFQYEKGRTGVSAAIPAIKGALNRLREDDIYEYAMKEGFVRIKGEVREMPKDDNVTINDNDDINSSDLIDSSDINFKGCRGSARDKDKDKDQDQEVLKFEELNKEGEEGIKVHKELESAEGLFVRTWGKPNKLAEEVRIVNEYIIKYGFDAVEFAFREGVKYNKMSLAYVDAICKKRKEKKDLLESKEREKKKLHESMLKSEEERKSGKCLTLVKDCYEGMRMRNSIESESN